MKKIAVYLMLITIISKILGFGREMALSYNYGASETSDAYLIAITIPATIFSLFASGIGAGYIPTYSKIMGAEGKPRADNFTSKLLSVLFIICTVIVIFVLAKTELLVKIFASGFANETLHMTVDFTKITILSIYFVGTVSIFSSYLQINGNYLIPGAIGIPTNIILIVSIFLSVNNNSVLAYGYLIAMIMQIILIIPFLSRQKYKYNFILDIHDDYIVEITRNSIPLILGISINQINVLVDRTIASTITTGGISALNYSNKVTGFILGIFVLSIATIIYPMISKHFVENSLEKFKRLLSQSIVAVCILVIPSTIGAMFFSSEVILLLFGRGAFDKFAMNLTTISLFYYSLGMLGFGLRDIFSRAFYAMQDTTTPMKNAVVGVLLNIILNIILSRYLGIGGLALATSISATFTTILLFISLRKKIGSFGMKQISISFLKILFVSLVMGGLAKLSFNYLTVSLSQNLSLLLAIGVGAVSYFVIIYFMKIEDVDVIVRAIKKKLGRGAA
jgi:putative peptidoglycan lipid II flippase